MIRIIALLEVAQDVVQFIVQVPDEVAAGNITWGIHTVTGFGNAPGFAVQAVEDDLLLGGDAVIRGVRQLQLFDFVKHVGIPGCGPGIRLIAGVEIGSVPLLTDPQVTDAGAAGTADIHRMEVIEDHGHTDMAGIGLGQHIEDIGIAAVPGSADADVSGIAAVLDHDVRIYTGDRLAQETVGDRFLS